MVILIVVGVIVLIVFWLISLYNGLVRLRNRRQNAFADIDVQLRQRRGPCAAISGYCKRLCFA